ncbi:MAG: GTP-binding protein [Asgard group archaeon]|nr:GTP-binding protein [Asgard group archaeon]
MVENFDCRKIVVLGNPKVGKTSIIQRYVHNQFKENYLPTLGFNIYTRYLTIGDRKIGLSIWDIGGQEAFKKFAFRYLVEADAAIFVTDCNRPKTVESLNYWNSKLEAIISREIPKVALVNKIDLEYDINQISERMISHQINKFSNGIVFASAKTGKNVVDIFSMLAKMFITWHPKMGSPRKAIINLNGAFRSDCLPVLFFSSGACSWCRPAFNKLNEIGKEYPLDIKVVDIEANTKLAQKHGILSIPTTIIGSKTIVGNSDEKILRTVVNDEYIKLFA